MSAGPRVSERELAVVLEQHEPRDAAAGARHLNELARRARLSPERERRLVAAAQKGDAAARAQLVEASMPLIASVARIYRMSPTVEYRELLQEGVVGLLRALERYDPGRGAPFSAYAGWWIRQSMQQLVAELAHPTVLSDRALRQLARLKDAYRQLRAESGREPSRRDLARFAGLEVDQVDNLVAVGRVPRSTEETVTGEDGVIGRFGELLADPLAEGEYERVLNAIEARDVMALLAGLSDRERMILRARHGLDGEQESLRQLADRLGLSAERVRQLEQRALGKLAVAAGVDPAEQ